MTALPCSIIGSVAKEQPQPSIPDMYEMHSPDFEVLDCSSDFLLLDEASNASLGGVSPAEPSPYLVLERIDPYLLQSSWDFASRVGASEPAADMALRGQEFSFAAPAVEPPHPRFVRYAAGEPSRQAALLETIRGRDESIEYLRERVSILESIKEKNEIIRMLNRELTRYEEPIEVAGEVVPSPKDCPLGECQLGEVAAGSEGLDSSLSSTIYAVFNELSELGCTGELGPISSRDWHVEASCQHSEIGCDAELLATKMNNSGSLMDHYTRCDKHDVPAALVHMPVEVPVEVIGRSKVPVEVEVEVEVVACYKPPVVPASMARKSSSAVSISSSTSTAATASASTASFSIRDPDSLAQGSMSITAGSISTEPGSFSISATREQTDVGAKDMDGTCTTTASFSSVAPTSLPSSRQQSSRQQSPTVGHLQYSDFYRLHNHVAIPLMKETATLAQALVHLSDANELHLRTSGAPSGEALYNMACCLALAATANRRLGDDHDDVAPGVPPLDQSISGIALVGARVDIAVSLLERAIGAGYRHSEHIRADPDLRIIQELRPARFGRALAALPGGGVVPGRTAAGCAAFPAGSSAHRAPLSAQHC